MRTHLAIGMALALLFLPNINEKILFIPIILIASILPDLDSGFSNVGKNFIFKPVQMVSAHRGIFHSLTICIIAAILLSFAYPPMSFPFFLGYSFHLLADSFTPNGIKPFWPLKTKVEGRITTGGKIEDVILIVLLVLDGILLISIFI